MKKLDFTFVIHPYFVNIVLNPLLLALLDFN